jgi:hypothetical protein
MSWPLKTCLACLLALFAAADVPAQPVQVYEEQRMQQAISRLQPQRPGVVDAYVVVAALDSDPVFNREAREAGRVLAGRFDAQGRTLVLAGDEGADRADAVATPDRLARALSSVASVMNRDEDVLILYTTSHGAPRKGLIYRDAAQNMVPIAPSELASMLGQPGFKNRLLILQACFSGQFVPALSAPRTIVVTAASSMTSSFGCSAGNDWTFFGYALINQAMRQPDTFARQFRRAFVTILGWEKGLGYESSNPQISVGDDTAGWLAALDAREPKIASAPVGKPPEEIEQCAACAR